MKLTDEKILETAIDYKMFPSLSAQEVAFIADDLVRFARAILKEARVEELERDAERLDWLAQHHDGFHNIDRISSVRKKFNGLPSLREAIDAAKAK